MGNNDIILINIPKPEEKVTTPLGLLYIGGALKKEGYNVRVFHFTKDQMDRYLQEILRINPLFVGFSVITGAKTKSSAIFSKKIKKYKNIPIIWGGVHPSLLPTQTASENYIDYVVVGEGEQTILELANSIKNQTDPSLIKGLFFKKDNEIFSTGKRPLMSSEELDQYFPDRTLLDMKEFYEDRWGCKRMLNLQTSRGCVFNCNFCYNLQFNEGRWRSRSVDSVMKEINQLKKDYRIDGVNFVDDFFFANRERSFKILEQTNLPWFGEMRIDLIDEDLVKKLAKSKAKQILFGFESGSDRMLKIINKNFNSDKIRQGVKLFSKYPELRVSGSFIMGLPGETKEDLFKTIDLILELVEIHPEMRYSFGIYLPYPGSKMYEEAIKKGFKPPKRTEDWEILDRGSEKLRLEWIDWMKDPKYYQRIRSYAHLIHLRNYNIPYFGNLPYKRLKNKDFNHDLEIKILNFLQKQFATQGTLFRKILTKLLKLVRRKN